MAERKDDEIMAEYLLKGGKMLEKTCPSCGCPLFEYKKKTFCVVCAEKKPGFSTAVPAQVPSPEPAPSGTEIPERTSSPSLPEAEMLAHELADTIFVLCQRIKKDEDPDRCRAFMDAVKIGTEALQNLRQR